MRAFPDTVKAADGYFARKAGLGFAKLVASHGFYIPIGGYDDGAAELAQSKGWIYSVTIDGVRGYKANVTVGELKDLDV